jgi:hypothetical protein
MLVRRCVFEQLSLSDAPAKKNEKAMENTRLNSRSLTAATIKRCQLHGTQREIKKRKSEEQDNTCERMGGVWQPQKCPTPNAHSTTRNRKKMSTEEGATQTKSNTGSYLEQVPQIALDWTEPNHTTCSKPHVQSAFAGINRRTTRAFLRVITFDEAFLSDLNKRVDCARHLNDLGLDIIECRFCWRSSTHSWHQDSREADLLGSDLSARALC